jgi:hypothetical protein
MHANVMTKHLRFTPLLLGFALYSCDAPTTTSVPQGDPLVRASESASAKIKQQLAALRRLTAPFHNFDKALAAGYTVQITSCLELPPLGGMGFHYGNPDFINGTVNLLQPELLLYEPQANGRLRFVGVEYIVPFTFVPATADPPTLLGQEFHRNFAFGLWGLHIWVGRHNPSGMFADWNPKVSCENAS